MKISMFLGRSKYWWAYLGIRSNPSIADAIRGCDAVFFDDPRLLRVRPCSAQLAGTKYFFISWDGTPSTAIMERARLATGPSACFTVLAVGDISRDASPDPSVQRLYPDGPMRFAAGPLRFDLRTSAILFGARLKSLLMPLKNILQSRGRWRETASLLFGRQRIVFCGSYGTTPKSIAELCARSSCDPRLFDSYDCFCRAPDSSFATYLRYLRSNGQFLAELYDRCAIDAALLRSAVHLLGRQYFIERLRAAGRPMFVNAYTGSANINVYTTPFYKQHLFLDFGSTVGAGNYPRLADLQYFRKRFVQIDLGGGADELAAAARSGRLEQRFDAEWERKSALILKGP